MSEEYSTALTLLAVGMITVFSILALIVLFGNFLILITNRYFPASAPVPKAVDSSPPSQAINPKKLAAIVTAVNIVTKGKGKVRSVEEKK